VEVLKTKQQNNKAMLLCIDFQPEYEGSFLRMIPKLKQRINRAKAKKEDIHFIYNKTYTKEGELLGNHLQDVIAWCRKNKICTKREKTKFIRKNFGFIHEEFRSGIGRVIAREILKEKIFSENNNEKKQLLTDLALLSHENDLLRLIERAKTGVNTPMIWEGGIKNWIETLPKNGIEITGGFKERCLNEVCILLESASIEYTLNEELIYKLPEKSEEVIPCPIVQPITVPNTINVEISEVISPNILTEEISLSI
jgi:hypothetical protein